MQKYVGVKLIEAVPGEKDGAAGYNIIYPDGYASWSPKDVFEAAYLPVDLGTELTARDIDQMLAKVQTSDADSKTTIVRAETLTGFSLFETASCVDPANYNAQKGTDLCVTKIRAKLWFAMGFVLQWAKYGLKHTAVQLEPAPAEGEDNGNPQ